MSLSGCQSLAFTTLVLLLGASTILKDRVMERAAPLSAYRRDGRAWVKPDASHSKRRRAGAPPTQARTRLVPCRPVTAEHQHGHHVQHGHHSPQLLPSSQDHPATGTSRPTAAAPRRGGTDQFGFGTMRGRREPGRGDGEGVAREDLKNGTYEGEVYKPPPLPATPPLSHAPGLSSAHRGK